MIETAGFGKNVAPEFVQAGTKLNNEYAVYKASDDVKNATESAAEWEDTATLPLHRTCDRNVVGEARTVRLSQVIRSQGPRLRQGRLLCLR